MKYIFLLSLITIGCQSKPKYSEFYLGCVNAYVYKGTQSGNKIKYGEAKRWCEGQEKVVKGKK